MNPGISDGRAPSIISASRRLGVRFATTQLTKSPPAGVQRRVVSTEYFLRFPSARPAWSFQTPEHARAERRSVRSHPAPRRYATRSIASAPTEARLTAIKVRELFLISTGPARILRFGDGTDLGCGKYEQCLLYWLHRRHSNPGASGRETHRAPA
jgi:hypothetical protein